MNATVDLVTTVAVVRNATTVSEISPACIDLILNIVLSTASLLVFIGTVIITYFVDDPGLRKLKRGTQQSESVDITESDKNYIRYLAERKFQNQIKGHTFSAFSPAYNLSLTTGIEHPELRRTVPYARRRACSESHTGHRMSDASSETQVILEHLLLPLGPGSSRTSLRLKPSFHVPFSGRRSRRLGRNSEESVIPSSAPEGSDQKPEA
ncbi:hypothetical protein CRM22_004750 [Opisthorchis felineus]|uniref:Uncharacterized protein n=1 Tax=Opisthorchis felineus TaxID=147828 RepID=A0A4S2M0Z5_OPIFE|nr:hypothetical protein CRM22_004750 [Opisthorchis felineus]